MSDPRHEGFQRRHREASERVRQKNLRDRGIDNVVPLRRPKPPRQLSFRPNAALYWAAIVALLIGVYIVLKLVQAA